MCASQNINVAVTVRSEPTGPDILNTRGVQIYGNAFGFEVLVGNQVYWVGLQRQTD